MDEQRLKSDEMLVAEVLSGRQAAFVELVEQYQGLVSHLVFRVVQDQSDREEVCQDVFVKVHKQLRTFQFRSKLSTWISLKHIFAASNPGTSLTCGAALSFPVRS